MFKIAVISDLHLDRTAEPLSWQLAEAAFRSAARADHVIVAGDLFDSASAMKRDRPAVEKLLRGVGLWHPERLTVVVGNHDVYEFGHRGGRGHRFLEAVRAFRGDGQANLETYSDWVGELVPCRDRHFSNSLFPHRRRLDGVTVVAADSVPSNTLLSAQGAWSEEEDEGVRALFGRSRGVRVLAVHNPPELADGALSLPDKLRGYVDGFPAEDYRRMESLADEARIDAVVAGHVHQADRWSWMLGERTRVRVAGRTGGLHGPAMLAFMEIGVRGVLRWRTVKVAKGR
jgi:predicted phosphodiesterase